MMKLGVSHQTPDSLTEERLAHLAHMGVETLEVRMPSEQATYDGIMKIKNRVEDAGIELHEVLLDDIHNADAITLGTDNYAETLAIWERFLEDLGRAGIKFTTYAWNTGGLAYETHRSETRGCPTRGFDAEIATALPNEHERIYSDDEMWENYETFVKDILPMAEANNVHLQLHPNDPPVTNRGVARIFRSAESFRRGMAISNNSPHNGVLFCVGTFGQMSGPEGQGEDVPATIRELGAKGLIHLVHLRNVDNYVPKFNETFPDNGRLDLVEVIRALGDVGFCGPVVPDHVPDTPDGLSGEAFVFGYLRALIQMAG